MYGQRNEADPAFSHYSQYVSDHLKVRDVLQKSRRIVGYKRSLTGVTEYEFYSEDVMRICRLHSHSLPYSFVSIEGSDTRWESEFEYCMISPGLTRYVIDPSTGETVAKVVYREMGWFRLNDSIDIFCDIDTYCFFAGDKGIALIEAAKGNAPIIPGMPEDGFEPRYDVYIIRSPIDKELLRLILAFPLLRF